MINKKHFIKIAEILNNLSFSIDKSDRVKTYVYNKKELVNALCGYFEEDNPLFDRNKFKIATG